MPGLISDVHIAAFLAEEKRLPAQYQNRLRTLPKSGHAFRQRDLRLTGEDGNEFRLFIRESAIDPLNFCVGLTYIPAISNVEFRLRRYDGKSHLHGNRLENDAPFFDFHRHTATERYQAAGLKEDHFAEITRDYADAQGALDTMIRECGFILPESSGSFQQRLL